MDVDGNIVVKSGLRVDVKLSLNIEWLKTSIDAGIYYIREETMEDGATDFHVRFGLGTLPTLPVFGS